MTNPVKNPRPKEYFLEGSTFEVGDGKITILKYHNCYDVDVMFEDGTIVKARTTNIKTGEVKNPNKVNVCGIGYYGQGIKVPTKSKDYTAWINMIHRAYSGRFNCYKDVTVCEEWHNFQNFRKWYIQQPNAFVSGFCLDKDLKIFRAREYSPATCSLIPTEVNSYITKNSMKVENGMLSGITTIKGRIVVQWKENKQPRCRYFDDYASAFNFRIELKTKMTEALVNKYRDVLCDDVISTLLNIDWSTI